MRAREILHEFKRGRDVKSSLGVGKTQRVREWMETYAPGVEYEYTPGNDRLEIYGDLELIEQPSPGMKGPDVDIPADDVYVEGYLDVDNSDLTRLPRKLKVLGYLSVQRTGIDEWPEELYVQEGVYAGESGLGNRRKYLQAHGNPNITINKGINIKYF